MKNTLTPVIPADIEGMYRGSATNALYPSSSIVSGVATAFE
eukprot:CAMPEP_0167770872 /NCGR_PEP_ID=MMETSP0110_2-20121227/18181_1 /TAXON_ID=629695 /ORGANISM="Gymnochlora sp., Strain CCMP2014" /LENGTH=40 /DNA_ID= /DNA_START= /DNA_END= /DNA_ORIENTATION=